MGRANARPAMPSLSLEPLPVGELSALDASDRDAEIWLLSFRGYNQSQIGERFGITRQAVAKILKAERKRRISRREEIDDDVENAVGLCEAIIQFSVVRAEQTDMNSMAGPAHMKNAMEALDRIVKLRGLDRTEANPGGGIGSLNLVLNIGRETPSTYTITADEIQEAELVAG